MPKLLIICFFCSLVSLSLSSFSKPVNRLFKESKPFNFEDWQISRSDVYLSYAPRDTASYKLPRFMIYTLDDIEGKLIDSIITSAVDSSISFLRIVEKRKFEYKGTNFTKPQIEVIKHFLTFVEEKGWD